MDLTRLSAPPPWLKIRLVQPSATHQPITIKFNKNSTSTGPTLIRLKWYKTPANTAAGSTPAAVRASPEVQMAYLGGH